MSDNNFKAGSSSHKTDGQTARRKILRAAIVLKTAYMACQLVCAEQCTWGVAVRSAEDSPRWAPKTSFPQGRQSNPSLGKVAVERPLKCQWQIGSEGFGQ